MDKLKLKLGEIWTNWKKWFYVALISVVAILVVALIWWLIVQPKKNLVSGPITKQSRELNLKIGIYGDLGTAFFSERTIKVDKGDIILLYPPSNLVRKISRGKMSQISLAELVTFTVPGSEEKLWLGDEIKPTAITCASGGYIKFSLEYPDAFSEFATYVKDGENYREAPLEIKMVWTKFSPKDYVRPRQIARPKGIVGALFPDFTVEVEGTPVDLRAESRKTWNGSNNKTEFEKWIKGQKEIFFSAKEVQP